MIVTMQHGKLTLDDAPGPDDAEAAADLLVDTYWNARFTRDQLVRAHLGSTAWVCARDERGKLVASARALADGAKHAWIYDVVVSPSLQGQGIGDAVVRRLLAHPAVAGCRYVHLGTRDAQGFYERMGFSDVQNLPPRPYKTTLMTLDRQKGGQG